MNEVIKAMLSRRSYRAYKPEQIQKSELNDIIECGLYAPSAMNTQNWHFTVVQNAELIEQMNKRAKELLSPEAVERMKARNNGSENFSIFYNAPTVIMVSCVKDDRYSLMNACYATENMCVAAESLDIGSIIIGMAAMIFDAPDSEEFMNRLNVPDGYKPVYAVCLGYKNMEANAPDRKEGTVNFIS